MRKIKTEALVLKRRQLLGKDITITLFSRQFGKIKALAKGASSLMSRRGPHLQTGNLIDVILYKKGDYWYLQETKLISAFSKVKDAPGKLNHQYLLFFILDRLLAEAQSEDDIYNLTKHFLIDLSENANFTGGDVENYLNRLLVKMGYIKERKSLLEISDIVKNLIHSPLPVLNFS